MFYKQRFGGAGSGLKKWKKLIRWGPKSWGVKSNLKAQGLKVWKWSANMWGSETWKRGLEIEKQGLEIWEQGWEMWCLQLWGL